MKSLTMIFILSLLHISCALQQVEFARGKSGDEGYDSTAFSLLGTWESPCVAGESGYLRINQEAIQTTVIRYSDADCTVPEVQYDFAGVYELGRRLPSPPYPEGSTAFTWQNSVGYVWPKTEEAAAKLNGSLGPEPKLCNDEIQFSRNRLTQVTAAVCMNNEKFAGENFTVQFGSIKMSKKGKLVFGGSAEIESKRPVGEGRVYSQISAPLPVGSQSASAAGGAPGEAGTGGVVQTSSTVKQPPGPVIVSRGSTGGTETTPSPVPEVQLPVQ